MKILFCSTNPKTKSLGAPKVIVELSEQLELLGWDVDFITPSDLLPNLSSSVKGIKFQQLYSQALKDYIIEHGHRYDVIEYDHGYLPYARSLFCPQTLMVARSVLLVHHFKLELVKKVLNKPKPNLKSRTLFFLRKNLGIHNQYYRNNERIRTWANLTCLEADLVNVANNYDYDELINHGVPKDKILVLPFGMNACRYELFSKICSTAEIPAKPKIAFVGTFDYRKGASDFPDIVRSISQSIPNITFRLIGTKGLFTSEREVLDMFPKEDRHRLEIIPRFEPDELPKLLQPCSLGIFPSYVEGFPFGVLEMLAASLPVIAYDAPGPPMMLPAEHLVPAGDTDQMAQKVVQLLQDHDKLLASRLWARERAKDFRWEDIVLKTSKIYTQKWEQLQTN